MFMIFYGHLWWFIITYDDFWRYDNLWWFRMIYHNLWFIMIYVDYDILSYELFIMKLQKVWFDITQAKWVIIIRMHVFMKLIILFILLHAPPHTQYISKCWPTYFYGLHSYQNVGTSCSGHIIFRWVTILNRQVISPFDSGTWVVQI